MVPMQQQYDLPDDERRKELENLRQQLDRAMGAFKSLNPDKYERYGDAIESVKEATAEIDRDVTDELDDIPEWDEQLVRDIVLEEVPRRETTVERVDAEIVHRFSVGPMGNETECRYAVAVTSGNEWFHVRRDDEWEEVWSN